MEAGIGFGYKIEWLAVHDRSAEAVAASLGLSALTRATWRDAVMAAYEGRWMLTPAVDGWTLAASRSMPRPQDDSRFGPWLAGLSESLGPVQYFGTNRVVDHHAWGRARGGVVERAFGYLSGHGEALFDIGEPTPEEQSLGVGFVPDESWWDTWNEEEDPDPLPDEETVLTLAGHWSVDPQSLEDIHIAASPWIAESPGR